MIFLPFFGTLLYLLLRRPGGTPEEREALDTANRDFVPALFADEHGRAAPGARRPA